MSQRRYELTDFEWSIIEPLLPNKPRGVPRARHVIEDPANLRGREIGIEDQPGPFPDQRLNTFGLEFVTA